MIIKNDNIFSKYLDFLDVKYTSRFSDKYFYENPNNNNLLGLSDMLLNYGVKSAGIKIEGDKEKILRIISPPFATFVGRKFGIVFELTDTTVSFWCEKNILIPRDTFLSLWNDVALIAEADDNSIEPEYNLHYRDDIIYFVKIILFFLLMVLMIGLISYSSNLYQQIGLLVSLFINFIGLGVTYLLITRQVGVQNYYAERICSVFHNNGCDEVLMKGIDKLLSIFTLSEIGFSYFVSNILIILFHPIYYYYVSVICVCALPFTIWSIWYQKVIIKEFCPLCLLVQIIIWGLFANNLLFGMIVLPVFSWYSIFLISCIYILPLLAINYIASKIASLEKLKNISHELNVIKKDEMVFKSVLKKTVKYDITRSTSSIIWGNRCAKNLITIITNPHCIPCAKMHVRLKQLHANTNAGYCFQYILTSFSDELENSVKLFISMYQECSMDNFTIFLDDWYSSNNFNKDSFFNKYTFDRDDSKILLELKKQKEWIGSLDSFSTPTVFFNGYKLPESYSVEDLVYFSNIDF